MWLKPIPAATIITLLLLCPASPAAGPQDYLKKPDAWFATGEAQQIAANILSFQTDLGGWPKNLDTTAAPFTGDKKSLKPTYDNKATTGELQFLARAYKATQNSAYRAAFDRGLHYVLQGQYQNGGWPQYHPPGKGYNRHITFNDDAMVRLLTLLREVATNDLYAFVDTPRRQQAATAFNRGIDCILKCQINVNGTLTAWCAQHDELDFQPRPARAFELAALSGAESVGITRLLMSLENPSPQVIQAVDAAVAWLEKSKQTGIRVTSEKDENAPKGTNVVVLHDPTAPPLWARFYDIETNKPLFVDRDGIPRPALADIGYERRNGYAWYGTWPQKLLEVEYPSWRKKIGAASH